MMLPAQGFPPITETYVDSNFSGVDNLTNFTGYTWDEVPGLYFAQNRFYDAESHRFSQEDPIKDGTNWFVYCGYEPGLRVNPPGLYAGQTSDATDYGGINNAF